LELLNIPDKKSVKKYCQDLTLTPKDLSSIIMAGRLGALEPYEYACHFVELVPSHLPLTANDKEALQANGVGPLSLSAAKACKKITQIFKDRRLFSAHLFFTPSHDYWHLIYLDQRDTDTENNHWGVGGAHIHYSRESFCRDPLPVVWEAICEEPPRPPGSIHIRFNETFERASF
jgi:hypothetical protein